MVAVLVAISVVVLRLTWESSCYGLTERSVITMAMVWPAALAIRLLRDGPVPSDR